MRFKDGYVIFKRLSEKQADVLRQLAQGKSHEEGAAALNMSVHAFRDHIKDAKMKTEVQGTTPLVVAVAVVDAFQGGDASE